MFDADGSGSIDAAELKAAFPLMGEKMSEQRMKQLFAEADADGSGEHMFDLGHSSPHIMSCVQGRSNSKSLYH